MRQPSLGTLFLNAIGAIFPDRVVPTSRSNAKRQLDVLFASANNGALGSKAVNPLDIDPFYTEAEPVRRCGTMEQWGSGTLRHWGNG
jgi:hypothetical protein